jgi:type II secretory pathway predicted ATPase ExeA/pSer/pThr/pTyr-binding forkhead associated (FHA) protein
MYQEFFRLDSRPFDISPDPRFVYMTAQHSRAIANMRFALLNRDSFVIITGEIGIGKTTIINSVLEELGPDYITAKLTHTTLSDIELLQALLSAFGMPNYSRKKVLLLDTLRDFFMGQHRAGRHVVIVVDEAQNLSVTALEELRLLSCIDTSERRIVSIVLTGQPGLNDLLDAPGLTQLRQRTRLRQHLDALNAEETADYVRHRLEVCGGDAGRIFPPESLLDIHRLTGGIPRLINTLCDTALMACMVDERPAVDSRIIDDVVQELRWNWFEEQRPRRSRNDDEPAAKPGQQSPRATLTVYQSGEATDQVVADRFPLVLGRSNANDVVLIDKEISRRHALIDCIGGIFVIEDLNSRNGILINQQKRSRALLRSGDIISLGPLDVVFLADPGAKAGSAGRAAPAHGSTPVSNEATGPQPVLPGNPPGPVTEPGVETVVVQQPGPVLQLG